MNAEIERAFVAALGPVLAPVAVVCGFTAEEFGQDDGGVIVDAGQQSEIPVGPLVRQTVSFRVDMPGLGAADVRAESAALISALIEWLRDRTGVHGAWVSDSVTLLPGYHISGTETHAEEDRLVASVEIIAGFHLTS